MWTFPFEIRTSRVVLRQWRQTDATAVWTLLSDQLRDLGEPSAGPHDTGSGVTRHLPDPQETSNATHQTDWVYAIREPENDEAIGFVGLHRRGTDGLELGYWLMTASRGRGYTTEAVRAVLHVCFAQPGLDYVQICCDPTNEPSIAVARRLGLSRVEPSIPRTHADAPLEVMVWRLTREEYSRGEPKGGLAYPHAQVERRGVEPSPNRTDHPAARWRRASSLHE